MAPKTLDLRRRGLTLVEVLLAVFILGIGVISVAAIFPAGIAQQRQSNDDVVGAIVAENALGILRTRIDRDAIGYGSFAPPFSGPGGIPGDFGWRRPAFVRPVGGANIDGVQVPKGSILIFNPAGGGGTLTDSEVPWNPILFGNAPPNIVITQRDRYWPMLPSYSNSDVRQPRPQYVWETMFRRQQGRVQVAIFVYRVTRPMGEGGYYVVQDNPSFGTLPPLPIAVNLVAEPAFQPFGPGGLDGNRFTLADNATVPNTGAGSAFDITNDLYAWQLPGQWLLDQNNNIHRVLKGRRRAGDGPVVLRQAPPILEHSFVHTQPGGVIPTTVDQIWFIPHKDNAGNTLTPAFVTVREL